MASQTDVEIRQATEEDIPSILSLIRDLAEFEHELSSVHATPELLSRTIAFDGQETSATRPARCLILTVPDPEASAVSASSDHDNTAPKTSPQTSATTATNSTFLSNTSPTSAPTSTPQSPQKRKTAALALYFHNYSTWLCTPGIYLEDLYVIPSERRKGHATLLLAHLTREVLKLGGGGGGENSSGGGVSGRLEWSVLKWNVEAVRFYEGETVGAKMMDEWVGMRVEGVERLSKLAGRGL